MNVKLARDVRDAQLAAHGVPALEAHAVEDDDRVADPRVAEGPGELGGGRDTRLDGERFVDEPEEGDEREVELLAVYLEALEVCIAEDARRIAERLRGELEGTAHGDGAVSFGLERRVCLQGLTAERELDLSVDLPQTAKRPVLYPRAQPGPLGVALDVALHAQVSAQPSAEPAQVLFVEARERPELDVLELHLEVVLSAEAIGPASVDPLVTSRELDRLEAHRLAGAHREVHVPLERFTRAEVEAHAVGAQGDPLVGRVHLAFDRDGGSRRFVPRPRAQGVAAGAAAHRDVRVPEREVGDAEPLRGSVQAQVGRGERAAHLTA